MTDGKSSGLLILVSAWCGAKITCHLQTHTYAQWLLFFFNQSVIHLNATVTITCKLLTCPSTLCRYTCQPSWQTVQCVIFTVILEKPKSKSYHSVENN